MSQEQKKKESNEQVDSSGEELDGVQQQQEGEESKAQSQTSSNTPSGTEGLSQQFTPEEIQALLEERNILKSTVQAQGQKLNELNAPKPEPEPEPELQLSNEDYWTSPIETQAKLIEQTVTKQLKTMIEPFKQNLKQTQEAQAWKSLEASYPDAGKYRELINTLLQANPTVDPTNVQQLQMLYFTAKGFASTQEKSVAGTSEVEVGNNLKSPPPQHRASSQPITKPGGDPRRRALTEAEQQMAKFYKMTSEEFLDFLEADERDVLRIGGNK